MAFWIQHTGENPLGTKVLGVCGVIFNQSLDTPNESISAPHQQLVVAKIHSSSWKIICRPIL
ncbi:MAG: hypothetical protein WCN27_01875 [Alphaproteobacteria bacterium]